MDLRSHGYFLDCWSLYFYSFYNCSKKIQYCTPIKTKKVKVFKRNIIETDTITGTVKLDEHSGEGIVWLNNSLFKTGII